MPSLALMMHVTEQLLRTKIDKSPKHFTQPKTKNY